MVLLNNSLQTRQIMHSVTSITQALNTQQIPEKMKIPWSNISMYVMSSIFGIVGGFLIVWQNLKRINKPEEARKFFIWGGIIAVIIAIFIAEFHIGYGYIFGFLFVIWFERFHMTAWVKENPNIKPHFGWAMVEWGLLGCIITIALYILLSITHILK